MLWPGGDAIRAQLGSAYYLLPVPAPPIWSCEWCRRRNGAEAIEALERERWDAYRTQARFLPPLSAEARPPLAVLPCELREYWPADVRIRATAGAGLPQPTLPDGRWVVCIPPGKSFGNIMPREWGPILKAAKAARGPLIDHAYQLALENLQDWERTGRDVMARSAERSRLLMEKGHLPEAEDPFPDCSAHVPLMSWVQEWTPHLYRADFPEFRPFDEARLALTRSVGFEPRTIESIVQRHRRSAAGAPGGKRVRRPV